MRSLVLATLVVILLTVTGCATVTGAVSGAFTGAVDLPRQTCIQNERAFDDYPMLYGFDVLIMGPIGIVTGPLTGLMKGLALDVQWVCGQISYGNVFGSLDRESVWRPHTFIWLNTKQKEAARKSAIEAGEIPEVDPAAP